MIHHACRLKETRVPQVRIGGMNLGLVLRFSRREFKHRVP
jgi:hypothetical protein